MWSFRETEKKPSAVKAWMIFSVVRNVQPRTDLVILLGTVGVHIKHVLSSDQLMIKTIKVLSSASPAPSSRKGRRAAAIRVQVKRSSSPPSSGAPVDVIPPAGIIKSNSN